MLLLLKRESICQKEEGKKKEKGTTENLKVCPEFDAGRLRSPHNTKSAKPELDLRNA